MNLSRNITLGLSIGTIVLFSGCAKGVQCRSMQDNSIAYVEAFKTSAGGVIVKDRGSLFSETTYSNNIKIEGNVLTGEKSKMGMFLTTSGLFAPWQMQLDSNNSTAQFGETKYNCNDGLVGVIQTIRDIKDK